MFSIKESLKYGWEKFKAHKELSLLTTLLLMALSFINGGEDMDIGTFFLTLAVIVLTIIVRISYTKIFLRIYDGETPKFSDIFQEYATFWKYIGVSILTGLACIGGLILLIVPGIIWAVRFSFSPIIVVDTKSGPIVAMKESYAITKGLFWKLLGFWLVIGLVNIAGFFAIGVGLLISVPVSTLATVYVYRILSAKNASLVVEPTEGSMPA